jgi:hypothetical protein
MSTFSPNLNIEEVARNADVGVWDTPTNNNWTLMDSVCGAIATQALNNSNVVLSAAQFQSRNITFNSTLTGSVTITFPTSFTKSYEIQHLCTGSSAFTITLATTAAGGQVIGCPPGEIIDVINDGTNLKYKNFGRIGEYWDYLGSSSPNWNDTCTIPPYQICAGGTISSAFYPVLTGLLGGTTLPDLRGRSRYMLDQGVGRVSSANCGIPGNTLLGAGGSQFLQTHTHANTATVNDPGHVHGINLFIEGASNLQPAGAATGSIGVYNSNNATTGITVTANNAPAGLGGNQNMPPVLVSGLMLIRAA